MLQGAQRNLVPYLTVRENVEFAQAEARRLGRGGHRRRARPGPRRRHRVRRRRLGHLSQGQLQMAALAVAMAPSPGVLLADEPTSALDRVARERILDALLRVNEEQGTTVVVVTHDPEVAARLPRTVTIRDGRIGGEGRSGKEYAVVTADGFVPLPVHVREELPPGTLLRLEREEAATSSSRRCSARTRVPSRRAERHGGGGTPSVGFVSSGWLAGSVTTDTATSVSRSWCRLE